MRNTWKKVLAAACTVSMLMTMPGFSVLADEMQEEEYFVTDAVIPEGSERFVGVADEYVAHSVDEIIEEDIIIQEAAEEFVGESAIQVGDDVALTFNEETGEVVFSSNDGTLWGNWLSTSHLDASKITAIRTSSTSGKIYLPEDSSGIFAIGTSLKTIDLTNFDTSKVTNMSDMFYDCSNLTSLNLSGFDTSRVTNMSGMFCYDGCLTSLNLSSFETSNVTDMNNMFFGVSANLDLSNFDTSSVTNMANMFGNCDNLTSLDLSSFNTSNVENMRAMFEDCDNLTSLDLSSFDTSNVTYMGGMFSNCSKLTNLNVSNFDTSNVSNMEFMFEGCSKLASLDLSNFNISNGMDTSDMFEGCKGLQILKTPKKNSSSVELPGTLYDEYGKEYTKLPKLSYSITLYKHLKVFTDVQDSSHPYYKAIYWAADEDITKGYSDGTFGINRSCTRGEMMMFLWRYAGKPAPKNVSKSPFKDVPKTHTFYKAILWGSQKGITKGYSDGTFGINRNVRRGECMMFLWRLKGKPAPKAVAKAPFPDVPKSHVFFNAVLWGYQKNITTGFTSGELKGKFGVNENCSRGQIVTFLYRAKYRA